jgi:hypothetical protein
MLFTQVLETEDDLIDHLGPAVSQGFSNEGFSMLAYGELQSEEILTVITDPQEVALLHCRVRHARDIGYGYFLRGIQVQEKLRWEPFARLRTAVDNYNESFQVAAPVTAVA